MKEVSMIDIDFDFQAEAGGRDSDKYSPTLQEYHRILWSKPLPSGKPFNLRKISDNRLIYQGDNGDMTLSSDRAVATFYTWKSKQDLISQVPKDKMEQFVRLTDSIGGIVIWPSVKIDGLPTINAARGFDRKIADMLDLTIECVRRYYLGENSPLYSTFVRYKEFFDLFEDFKGFIDFFLLQDAVSDDYSLVKIASPFDNFESSPVPNDLQEYIQYMEFTSKLVSLRNERISDYSRSLS